MIDVASNDWDWSQADPTLRGTRINNSARITEGLFKTDPNKSFLERAGLLALRFSPWEIGQTMAGYYAGQGYNTFWKVNVSYYGGATLVNRDDLSGEKWGFTLGPFINSKNMKADPYSDPMFRHEYGHTLQSHLVGPLYLPCVALPSLIGQGLDDLGLNIHKYEWYETQANRMAYDYFNKYDSGALDVLPWDDDRYPRGYHPTWYWIPAHPPVPFLWWLFF